MFFQFLPKIFLHYRHKWRFVLFEAIRCGLSMNDHNVATFPCIKERIVLSKLFNSSNDELQLIFWEDDMFHSFAPWVIISSIKGWCDQDHCWVFPQMQVVGTWWVLWRISVVSHHVEARNEKEQEEGLGNQEREKTKRRIRDGRAKQDWLALIPY